MTARSIEERLGADHAGHPRTVASGIGDDVDARDDVPGLSPPALVRAGGIAMMLSGLALARVTAALFGAALIAVGWRAWRASADFLPAPDGR